MGGRAHEESVVHDILGDLAYLILSKNRNRHVALPPSPFRGFEHSDRSSTDTTAAAYCLSPFDTKLATIHNTLDLNHKSSKKTSA